MKQLVLALALCCSFSFGYTQDLILDHGGGGIEAPQGICLNSEQRDAIQKDLAQQIKVLEEQGILSAANRSAIVDFSLPIQGAEALDWNNIYGISNYVDQTPGSGIGDYNCGERTYNGHLGTDYFTWPFPHYLKDNDLAHVVAAAPGTIIQKLDGQFDEQCSLNPSLTWNAVYVSHSDGSVAWYGHLKEGSLTSKSVGETVERGEYLGVVASSGFSSGPHLHFEVRDTDNNIIDPYMGVCNSLNSESWWTEQDSYVRMELNTLLTHDIIPEHGCPSEFENPNMQSYFNNSDIVYLIPYFKDQDPNITVTYTVFNPLGSVWTTWEHSSDDYYGFSWWYWTVQMPLIGAEGEWIFRAEFDGQVHDRSFFLEADPPTGIEEELSELFFIAPNPAKENLYIRGDVKIEQWRIYNSTGKIELISDGQIRNSIDIRSLSRGLYIVELISDSGNSRLQFVKE